MQNAVGRKIEKTYVANTSSKNLGYNNMKSETRKWS